MIAPLAPGECHALVRSLAGCPDPIELLTAAGSAKPGNLLLETAEVTGDSSKSLVVVASALCIRCRGRSVVVQALSGNGRGMLPWLEIVLAPLGRIAREEQGLSCEIALPQGIASEEERLRQAMPTSALRALIFGIVDRLGQPSSAPLLVGTFAYDLIDSFEALPAAAEDPLGWPDYELWLPELAIWIDHRRRACTVIGHVFCDQAYGDIVAAVARAVAQVEQQTASNASAAASATLDSPARKAPALGDQGAVATDMDDASYARLVGEVKQRIVAGDVFQIVPSRTFSLPCSDPLGAYRQLRALNPSPYMFYICGETGVLFGASPETALKVDGTPRRAQIKPIAGTRPRGRYPDGTIDSDLDSRYEASLRLDSKEVAEHMMLVDLARNDIARVSSPGTRHVDQLLQVERYSHVMHLVSRVTGRLRPDLDALDAYVATMNMGTLVGAPKVRAAQLLREYEATRRGPYGGAVGYVTTDGRMDTGIVIRSAVVRDGQAYVRAGAGVVYDSDPIAEAEETRRKAQAVLTAIGRANAEASQKAAP